MIAARVLVTGTHTGPGFPAAPKGNRTSSPGMCIARVKDGKIIESWNNFDFHVHVPADGRWKSSSVSTDQEKGWSLKISLTASSDFVPRASFIPLLN
jgi:hypothetical protein